MRNPSCDLNPARLKQLAGLAVHNNDLLKKARESHALENYIAEVVDNGNIANRLGVELHKSFTELRNDFNNSVINLVRYREGLSHFKDFFDGSITKSDLPVTMQAKEILLEINKIF